MELLGLLRHEGYQTYSIQFSPTDQGLLSYEYNKYCIVYPITKYRDNSYYLEKIMYN